MYLLVLLASVTLAQAELVVKVNEPKQQGAKAVIKLTLKNTFPENIESARATAFLSDSEGKVIVQSTKWVIGGSPKSRPLPPDSTTNV
jgi:hypothetical protein